MKYAKCRSCRQPIDREEAVRVGGNRYHPTCADHRLKARQRWNGTQWIKEGHSY